MIRTFSQRIRDIIGDQFGAQIVEMNLEKAIRDAQTKASTGAGQPVSTFYDPMQLFMGREWLWKRHTPLGFPELRLMAKNPIIASIIQTRINQVAAFCSPQLTAYDYGFIVKSEDPEKAADTEGTKNIRDWLYTAGLPGYGEPLLETFVRKFIRDSLELDQACAEIVYRRDNLPAYFIAVDSASIRRLKATLEHLNPAGTDVPMYVQLLNDIKVAEYTYDQLIFGIRNPQSDMKYAGYGMSELETLVRIVTGILNTERYNIGQMAQGGTSKGILVVKGEADRSQVDSFKRDFREAVRNAAAYWRPPVLQVGTDADVSWVTLDRSNRDMEYAHLFDFLVKQACGVYQMDPAEINWQIGNTGGRMQLGKDYSDKVRASQSKGLRPLLKFLSNTLTYNLIHRIDPTRRVEFVGIMDDRQQDVNIRQIEVQTYKTINEQRGELGLEPIPYGDIILNQSYLAAAGVKADPGGTPAIDDANPDPNPADYEQVDVNQELGQE